MFLHFYINPSGRGKERGRGRVAGRVRVPVRGCCSDIFLTICILHTPWPGKRNENGGNDLLISEVCAHTYIHTYIRTYSTSMSVWQCERSIEIWIGMNCAGQGEWGQGERYEVWIGYGNGNECTWRVRVSASSTSYSYTALATYQKFLCGTIYDSCSSVCTCMSVCACVCVKIYGVLENCVRRTLKVCQKICRKTRQKQIYMRRRSLCIKCFVWQESFSKSFWRAKEQRRLLRRERRCARASEGTTEAPSKWEAKQLRG